jgi:hypothetical protein
LISVTNRGSFDKTKAWLKRMQSGAEFAGLEKYGPIGVNALKQATPVEHGTARDSWYYEIIKRKGYFSIQWLNSDVANGTNIPIVILIQYGHGTRQGGYVQGRDFINPAMRPIFDQIANDMWREVTK